MKNKDENSVKLRENMRKTPFEKAEINAKKRALLAQIHAETRQILESYEHLQAVAKTTGMPFEAVEKLADDAIIELAETMEKEFGVSA